MFQDIAVADCRTDKQEALALRHLFKSQIAHDGRDNGFSRQHAPLVQITGQDGHHDIPVAQLTLVVDGDQAVRVTVKGEPEMSARFKDVSRKIFRMGRPAVAVDIETVRLDTQGRNFGAQGPEQGRCRLEAGAVGAIDHKPHSRKIEIGDGK